MRKTHIDKSYRESTRGAVLYLILKGKWFDMIESGIKQEEYREMKPYWKERLLEWKKPEDVIDGNGMRVYEGKYRPIENGYHFVVDRIGVPRDYKFVSFRLGYRKNAPTMLFRIEEINMGCGKAEWGAPVDKKVFIIKLGERIK